MFVALLLFFASLIVELLIVFLFNPIDDNGSLNLTNILIFGLNTGLLLGSLFALLQVLVYGYLSMYDEIASKVYIRRAFIFWYFNFFIGVVESVWSFRLADCACFSYSFEYF
ncbi:MAG: hypothetical protein KatS3mg083_324 [Candidatus Dojkabacteria bacterium]|nr:MAG: hypothetical protein KatS3mg083_324 [Candidatus Dojkabacteria bacterium]